MILIDGALRLLFSDLAGPVNIGNPYECPSWSWPS